MRIHTLSLFAVQRNTKNPNELISVSFFFLYVTLTLEHSFVLCVQLEPFINSVITVLTNLSSRDNDNDNDNDSLSLSHGV